MGQVKLSTKSHAAATEYVLGLDLGPKSIGWSLIDNAKQEIVATGSRVFPEGVERDKGNERAKNQTRREKRGLRRQIQRRARRLTQLRNVLASVGLLPEDMEEQDALLAGKETQGAVNPYALRFKALNSRLELFELGQVLVHLAQRRGFLSNRKADRRDGKDETGKVLGGIEELNSKLRETGSRSLGEYLHRRDPELGKDGNAPRIRLRGQIGLFGHIAKRAMLDSEFELIWNAQRDHHPELLTESLKYGTRKKGNYPDRDSDRQSTESVLSRYGLHGLIFFQRRVYWPKFAIGRCDLEPSEYRCQKGDRIAQRFRIAQEVNNLRWRDPATGLEHRLTPVQRQVLIDSLRKKMKMTVKQIVTLLAKSGLPTNALFNLKKGDRDELLGHLSDARLAAAPKRDKRGNRQGGIGKRYWDLPEGTKDRIVALILEDRKRIDETEAELLSLGLTLEESNQILHVALPSERMSYSRKAMEKLLPFVEQQGMDLLNEDISKSAKHAASYFSSMGRSGGRALLGPVPKGITNPLVRQALFEARQLINDILRRYGRPARIRIELARNAKRSAEDRKKALDSIKKIEKLRADARTRLQEHGLTDPKRNDIQRYLLGCECSWVCVYCGVGMGIAQLIEGDVDMDHILPRWRSLDDSYMNKVLVHRHCNSGENGKNNRTPREWLESNPARWHAVLALAENLPPAKYRRIAAQEITTDFSKNPSDEQVGRSLGDTAYVARQVTDYLQQLGISVQCSRGTITAELRRYWELNNILGDNGEKNRSDHRHHAVDATVIALTTPALVRELAYARGGGKDGRVDPPWPDLRNKLDAAVKRINVSHRPQRRLSGALHEDTFYGATHRAEREQLNINGQRIRPGDPGRGHAKDWVEKQGVYTYRKPVSAIKGVKTLEEVRDRSIRECLERHLRGLGVDPTTTNYNNICKGVFEGENVPKMPSGVPIKKVRLVVEKTTLRWAGENRKYQFVQPGNNHHIAYYELDTPKGKKWTARVVATWDASLRARRDKLPPVDRSDDLKLGRFVMSLSIGESFIVWDDDGTEQVRVVRQIWEDGRIVWRSHVDARPNVIQDPVTGKKQKIEPTIGTEEMRKRGAKKVLVTHLGELRRAGD